MPRIDPFRWESDGPNGPQPVRAIAGNQATSFQQLTYAQLQPGGGRPLAASLSLETCRGADTSLGLPLALIEALIDWLRVEIERQPVHKKSATLTSSCAIAGDQRPAD
jgi:hypothetical protein